MMTDVKRMTAKEDFLKMPLKDRNCEVEFYEDCRTRKLLKECNCFPWEVPGQGYQVYLLKHEHFTVHSQVCGPKGRDCIERYSSNTFNCSSTCKGIYANVQWVGKSVDEDLTQEKFACSKDGEQNQLEKRLDALVKYIKKMENDRDGKGEEVDAEKYKMLIAEYKRFKKQRVQHIRFQSEKGFTPAFGKNQ